MADQTAPRDTRTGGEGKGTVLVADDDYRVRILVCLILERAGYVPISANDGEEAVRLFREHDQRIDLLLFDMLMPNLDGLGAYRRIAEIRPDIPVLFCSGFCGPSFVSTRDLPERSRLISKPFSADGLLRNVREMLEMWETKRHKRAP